MDKGEATGATGGIGSGKISSALPTLYPHDVILGIAHANGADAKV